MEGWGGRNGVNSEGTRWEEEGGEGEGGKEREGRRGGVLEGAGENKGSLKRHEKHARNAVRIFGRANVSVGDC